MTVTLDFLFRVVTLFIFFLWWCYWAVTAKEADQQKPKTSKVSFRGRWIRRWFIAAIEVVMLLQILGLQLLPIQGNAFFVQVFGFALVVIGSSTAFSARRILGTNWTHAYEYQIKKEHALVTGGIYSLIRHPIYTGLYMALIGGELVAQSYLGMLFVLFFVGGYWQAKQEEEILSKHFGSVYRTYMQRTKMFIPYLW